MIDTVYNVCLCTTILGRRFALSKDVQFTLLYALLSVNSKIGMARLSKSDYWSLLLI